MSLRKVRLKDYKKIYESENEQDKVFQQHLEDAMQRIEDGEMPEDVFDVDGDWGSGCLRIKLDDMYNMLTYDRKSGKYNLLFDKWYGLYFICLSLTLTITSRTIFNETGKSRCSSSFPKFPKFSKKMFNVA